MKIKIGNLDTDEAKVRSQKTLKFDTQHNILCNIKAQGTGSIK